MGIGTRIASKGLTQAFATASQGDGRSTLEQPRPFSRSNASLQRSSLWFIQHKGTWTMSQLRSYIPPGKPSQALGALQWRIDNGPQKRREGRLPWSFCFLEITRICIVDLSKCRVRINQTISSWDWRNFTWLIQQGIWKQFSGEDEAKGREWSNVISW